MAKCEIKDCNNLTLYKNTIQKYCSMHLARIRRNGYPELKRDAYQSLEKLPHKIIDDYILKNSKEMLDREIVIKLTSMGYKNVTKWNIGYRRRKLGGRKYLRGEIQKHRAWIRLQAINKYGKSCELCGYNIAIETHHILPRHQGGPHEIDNLMVLCPNCHSLITRRQLTLTGRNEIPKVRKKILKSLKSFYAFL